MIDKYPYTNMHEINLDWIISQIKSIDPELIAALRTLDPDTLAQVKQQVQIAEGYATTAQSFASAASTSADACAESASNAAGSASAAGESASNAAESASSAASSLSSINSAIDSAMTPQWVDSFETIFNINSDITNLYGRCYLYGKYKELLIGYLEFSVINDIAKNTPFLTWKNPDMCTLSSFVHMTKVTSAGTTFGGFYCYKEGILDQYSETPANTRVYITLIQAIHD